MYVEHNIEALLRNHCYCNGKTISNYIIKVLLPTDAQENCFTMSIKIYINPLNAELNPICYLLALLGAQHFLHVSRIRVKSLTFRLLMSYIHSFSSLSYDRSKASSKASSPHRAIQSFLFQMRVSSPFLKVIQ